VSAIWIFGAGGLGKELYFYLQSLPNNVVADFAGFIEPAKVGKITVGSQSLPVASEAEPESWLDTESRYILGVADPKLREKLYQNYSHLNFPSWVHPSAQVAESVTVGSGVVVRENAVVTPDTVLGTGCYINYQVSVGHDSVIGDFSSLNPGCHVSGNVELGKGCLIGARATVLQGLKVAPRTVVGAGATVTKSLDIAGVYVGTPARLRV